MIRTTRLLCGMVARLCVVGGAFAGTGKHSDHPPRYRIVALGTLVDHDPDEHDPDFTASIRAAIATSKAISINNHGEIVGDSAGIRLRKGFCHAFLWHRGKMRDLARRAKQPCT